MTARVEVMSCATAHEVAQRLNDGLARGERVIALASDFAGDFVLVYEPAPALDAFGRCGLELTDDLSRARGIGPVCWEKL